MCIYILKKNSLKPVFIITLFFVIIVMLFPLLIRGDIDTVIKAGESPQPTSGLWMSGSAENPDEPAGTSFDSSTSIRLIRKDGSAETLSMRDYLIGVVSAEMPAIFEPEALKAQAVAARTYSLFRMTEDQAHEGGALCTEPGCCNAYLSTEALKEKWGEDFEKNLAYITEAVMQTDGICISYDGKPIFAAFHSSSIGRTENSENVWRKELPYLRSVTSPETASDVPNYISDVTISFKEIRSLASEAYPEAKLGSDPKDWLTGAVYTENGRLARINFGGVELRGTDLRSLFGLRSAYVSWRVEEDGILFETTGYGHGVGLSQYGANVMAKNGADYVEILKHYYTGIDIAVISTAPEVKDSV